MLNAKTCAHKVDIYNHNWLQVGDCYFKLAVKFWRDSYNFKDYLKVHGTN